MWERQIDCSAPGTSSGACTTGSWVWWTWTRAGRVRAPGSMRQPPAVSHRSRGTTSGTGGAGPSVTPRDGRSVSAERVPTAVGAGSSSRRSTGTAAATASPIAVRPNVRRLTSDGVGSCTWRSLLGALGIGGATFHGRSREGA